MHLLIFVAQLITAFALISGQGMFYKTTALKGYGYSEADKVLGPFYIPDRQCSGVVHNLTRVCEYVDVVQVQAVDAVAYPEVSVDSLLERAAVRRRAGPRGCLGRLTVHVAVGCGEARRSARAITEAPSSLPQLPESRRLPPMSPPPYPPHEA